jgi:trigger factor
MWYLNRKTVRNKKGLKKMKKNTVLLFVGLCALTLLGGCGKDKNKDGEEAGRGYDPADYVTLGDYKGLEISVEKTEVTDASVQAYVEGMIAQYSDYETTEKTKVEDGDYVNIDYEGLQDGVAFSGGTASDQVLEIGSGRFIDGFEEGLIGANVGDKLALNLTFPDPYENNPDLAGKEVVFNVTVNSIVTPVPAAYDTLSDAYVVRNFSYYGFTTAQGMKDNVKQYLDSQNEYAIENSKRSAILEKLAENCQVKELPEGLLDKRVNDYKEKFEAMCQKQYGKSAAEVLQEQYQKSEEDFNTEAVEYMKENLETELILLAIADKEGIELDEEGFQEFVSSMLSNYGYSSEDELYAEYEKSYVQDSYRCNQAISMLAENAKVNYTEPSAAEE